MVNNNSRKKLFSDFGPVSTSLWMEKIRKDIKEAPYEQLIWKTFEKIEFQPFYRAEDIAGKKYLQTPFSVFRDSESSQSWEICQDIYIDDPERSNSKAVHALNHGATSVRFFFPEHFTPDKGYISKLIKDISPGSVRLNFTGHLHSENILDSLLSIFSTQGSDPALLRGSLDSDPIGFLSTKGFFKLPEEEEFSNCARLFRKSSGTFPGLRIIGINPHIFHTSGGSIIQELGFSLAMISEYLGRLSDHDLPPGLISGSMQLNFAVGPVYFMEIAKLRAARILFANLVKSWDTDSEASLKTFIHCTTSDWTQTLYDPHVNILRATTQCMSAALGGADSISVNPFDKLYKKDLTFSERIARNTQIILKEEAFFDRVSDPSSGSYYIEMLTDSIVRHSWDLFLKVEDMGGYIKAFRSGKIQELIKETARERKQKIAAGREVFVGTNKYADPLENIKRDFLPSITSAGEANISVGITEPLAAFRGAEEFEEIRRKTWNSSSGVPKVFLLTYGNPSWRRTRAGFANNFFSCGGFEVIDNHGFDSPEEGISEALLSEAPIVVLCSSDDEYLLTASQIHEKLGDKKLLVIAGYPKAHVDELKAQGIAHFIHLKSDIIEELRKYQKLLSI